MGKSEDTRAQRKRGGRGPAAERHLGDGGWLGRIRPIVVAGSLADELGHVRGVIL